VRAALTSSVAEAFAFIRSRPGLPAPDILTNAHTRPPNEGPPLRAALTTIKRVSIPASRGQVSRFLEFADLGYIE
jgi:hypothetical protein